MRFALTFFRAGTESKTATCRGKVMCNGDDDAAVVADDVGDVGDVDNGVAVTVMRRFRGCGLARSAGFAAPMKLPPRLREKPVPQGSPPDDPQGGRE
jgi:hypothetical protein